MRPLLGPVTTLLSVQHGIVHLNQLRATLGNGVVLGGMAMINAHSPTPGVIERPRGPHFPKFGELGGEPSVRCTAIAQALTGAGMEAVISPKIAERMWWKLVGICGASVFCLMRANKGQVWDFAETPALMHQILTEGVAVAHAHGIALAPTLPAEMVKIANTFPP